MEITTPTVYQVECNGSLFQTYLTKEEAIQKAVFLAEEPWNDSVIVVETRMLWKHEKVDA